ncbi:DUF3945 domain-containing protein [Flavobacterium tructae]|uniref:DUF3945 domain-containing protein n=1 Tax=Flavobacterium tructae TaxID=1114873 RepID=UPI0025520AA9|nr:DUF3945 domain-containing protein [Flavobacterium tructae]MDL2141678.1 DUF3945 domain-containing protein [Flavobacterium tructae]
MSEQTLDKEQSPQQFSEILLVLDKEKKKIQAVKGIDAEGNLETVDPTKKNQNQFMRVDKQGNLFSNFFSNFISQLKNPTDFSFFKVTLDQADIKAKEMQKQVETPTPEGEKLMKEHEVKIPEQGQTNAYRYQPEQIDWETLNNLGLGRERLAKLNILEPLLKGYKTNELVPVNINLGGAIIRTDARLSLQPNKEGEIVVAIHGIRKEPNLQFEFFGHSFSQLDKKNLQETGNMGRVVNLNNPNDKNETIPSIISIDRMTNEIVALRTDFIKIPDNIKGVVLNEEQKQTLMEGRPLYLEGMISNKGTSFNAELQYNADKRGIEYNFDRNPSVEQSQENQQGQPHEVSKTFRGKELDDEQYQKFKEGQTVYVSGLEDKKGQSYNGYITFNKETGKTNFEFPGQYMARVETAEAHKAQIAVNSEGKTNEATKNIKESLESGQQKPKNEKQQEQQEQHEQPETPARSKGRKM